MTTKFYRSCVSTTLFLCMVSTAHQTYAEQADSLYDRQDSIVTLDSMNDVDIEKTYSNVVSGQLEVNELFDLTYTAQLSCSTSSGSDFATSQNDYRKVHLEIDQLRSLPQLASTSQASIQAIEPMVLNMLTSLIHYQNTEQPCQINTFSATLISKDTQS